MMDGKPRLKHVERLTEIQRDSKNWTQFRMSIFPELYKAYE